MMQWNHMYKLESINLWKLWLVSYILPFSKAIQEDTNLSLWYHQGWQTMIWENATGEGSLWAHHSPQLLIGIPCSQDLERCWFSAKKVINPKGMSEGCITSICKTQFWFTTFSLSTLTKLVVALFVGKIFCSTEGNQTLVCLSRLTRFTQQNCQVQLFFDLFEHKTHQLLLCSHTSNINKPAFPFLRPLLVHSIYLQLTLEWEIPKSHHYSLHHSHTPICSFHTDLSFDSALS